VFDEIFNSTNVVEGVAAAYAILDTLGERSNCTTIITTHYPYLCKLPNFDRYKMNAQLDEQMRVERFPYRLTKGVSNQYIALEMLRENFDPVIVDRAITVKNRLLDTKRGRNKFKRKKF
jgi:DNA mismatch repair ATPase MutS